MRVDGVRRSGDEVRFFASVTDDPQGFATSGTVDLRVTVNGEVEDRTVALYDSAEFTAEVPAGATAIVRVQQMLDGSPISVVETAFPPVDGAAIFPSLDVCAREEFDASVELPEGLAEVPSSPSTTTAIADLPEEVERRVAEAEAQAEAQTIVELCEVAFVDPIQPSRSIEVALGRPAFELPGDLSETACYRWASIDDGGGFVAIRDEPVAVYVIAGGFAQAEFEAALSSTTITSGDDTWSADEGC
jgi:hypothetical protein